MTIAAHGRQALAALLCVLAPLAAAHAQVTTRDTVVPPDAAPKRQRPDSIQHRIGRDDITPTLEIGDTFTYDRDELFRTGALTLGDLFDRVPTLTTFRVGWLPSPQATGYGGDFTRIRLFLDGIELDDLEGRNGAAPDLHAIPLWALEKLSIVRTATDVRVDMKSWEYNNTSPYTRVDVLTGDLNTNMYRAYYGKRYYNGAGLQIAAQQYGVTDVRNGGGGQQFGFLARYGVARSSWSLDATAIRTNGTRIITTRFGPGELLPSYRSANTIGYLRGAIGKEGSGPFLQLVASTQILREYSSHTATDQAQQYGFPADTVDSLASTTQYVATAGFDAYGGRLRLIERYRTRLGAGYNSPSATFDLTHRFLSLNALAERDEYAGLTRVEVGGRLIPIPFLAVAGYVGSRTAFGTPAPGHIIEPSSRSARVEGGLRVLPAGLWLTGGVVTRDTAVLVPPAVFDSAFATVVVGRQTGTTIGLNGPLIYNFSVNASMTHWKDVGPYAPQDQAHGELRFFSQWLSRFPNGNFSFLFQPMVDYRSETWFPGHDPTTDRFASASRIFSVLVELRILRGVLSYQRRNIAGSIYDQVPGFLMPRPVNVYGVRWYFYN